MVVQDFPGSGAQHLRRVRYGARPASRSSRTGAWNRSRDKAEPLTQDGVQVFGTPEQAASFIKQQTQLWDAVIKAANIPPQ